ncbi:hypothetical protein D3C73_1174810 [compost metagenome]
MLAVTLQQETNTPLTADGHRESKHRVAQLFLSTQLAVEPWLDNLAKQRAVSHAGHFVVAGRHIHCRQRRVGAAACPLQIGQLAFSHFNVFAMPPCNTGTTQTVFQRGGQGIHLLLAHIAHHQQLRRRLSQQAVTVGQHIFQRQGFQHLTALTTF